MSNENTLTIKRHDWEKSKASIRLAQDSAAFFVENPNEDPDYISIEFGSAQTKEIALAIINKICQKRQ